jgi:hypothetical protein
MPLPNYRDGSLVNLMSTITQACGARSSHRPLAALKPKDLKSKRTVLLLADGLGYEFLKQHKGFLWDNVRGKLTSVFPSTTAAAITTIRTGASPAEHALTGWFMHAKELGGIVRVLPGTMRAGGYVDTTSLFSSLPLYLRLKRRSFIIAPSDVSGSLYTQYHSMGARVLSYNTMDGFFRELGRALKSRSCFVYAYWPAIDVYSHHFGTRNRKTVQALREFERALKRFLAHAPQMDMIVTGDHGLIDIDRKHALHLDDHPRLAETLTLPFSGEARALYCYVHPGKDREFRAYVRKRLGHACRLYRSEQLLPWFGEGRLNPKLCERIGDYILVMKENYIMRDRLPGERAHFHLASHGGISKEEMHVPLIVFTKD